MANFRTHATVAAIAGISASYWLVHNTPMSIMNGVVVGLLAVFGGLLPDIDAGNSRINRMVFGWITILSLFIFIFQYLYGTPRHISFHTCGNHFR
jgi:hypothetical protein